MVDEYSAKEIALAVVGGGGLIGGCVALFSFVAARLDARTQKTEADEKRRLADAVEMRRIEAEREGRDADALVENLWKLIGEKDSELKAQRLEIADLETKATTNRPMLLKVYANLRAMRREIESLNVMVLSEEETNVFMRRFQTVKVLLDDTESLLP